MTKERKIELLLNESKLKVVEQFINYSGIDTDEINDLNQIYLELYEEIINLIKG